MHVYCTDGTVFECKGYDVNEFGIVLYGKEEPRGTGRYDSDDPSKIGFVPHSRLWYVLPDDVTPQTGHAPVPAPASGNRTGPGGAQQGQAAPGQGQSPQGQTRPPHGQAGPGRSPAPGQEPPGEQPNGGQ